MRDLSHARLTDLLSYDRDTGRFYWAVSRGNQKSGSAAGRRHHSGYWEIRVDGVLYRAHRLAWFYVHKSWPKTNIDHEDTNKENNTEQNLRPADNAQNGHNRRATVRSISGIKGVSRRGRRWSVRIGINNTTIYVGTFDTREQAADGYNTAANMYHGEFARSS